MKLRTLNDLGLDMFREYLNELRAGSTGAPPSDLLTDDDTSMAMDQDIEMEDATFPNRRAAAAYLKNLLKSLTFTEVESNISLWSWLDLFFFDSTCPPDSEGARKPGADYRHILSIDFRHKYRHLLFGPYRIFLAHPDSAYSLLCGPLDKPGDFNEQVGSRIEKISNSGLIKALDDLYYSEDSNRVKKGASDRKKRGSLRRFLEVTDQFDVTFDLFSMTPEQIEGLLPVEFNVWRESDH